MNQPEDWNEREDLDESGESFEELEEYLTHAMRRVDAPEGFVDRVMLRARPAPVTAKILSMPSRTRAWAGGAIAAALLAGVFTGQQVHVRHQREQAQLAQQQFEAGMRITDEALDHVRDQLAQAGVR